MHSVFCSPLAGLQFCVVGRFFSRISLPDPMMPRYSVLTSRPGRGTIVAINSAWLVEPSRSTQRFLIPVVEV
jgi:hypothetical protein